MMASLARRLAKLEEVVESERASKVKWTVFWVDPETGEETDATAAWRSRPQT